MIAMRATVLASISRLLAHFANWTTTHLSAHQAIGQPIITSLYNADYRARTELQRLQARGSSSLRAFSSPLIAMRDDLVIFDVGARGGILPKFEYLRKSAEWHLFEPDPREYRRLQNQYRREDRVKIHQLALDANDGVIDLHVTLKPGVASTLRPTAGGRFTTVRKISVSSATVATYCAETGARPFLIKLDTQGTEHRIFRGLGPIRPLVIWTELEGPGRYEGALEPAIVCSMLMDLGYELVRERGDDYLFILRSELQNAKTQAVINVFDDNSLAAR